MDRKGEKSQWDRGGRNRRKQSRSSRGSRGGSEQQCPGTSYTATSPSAGSSKDTNTWGRSRESSTSSGNNLTTQTAAQSESDHSPFVRDASAGRAGKKLKQSSLNDCGNAFSGTSGFCDSEIEGPAHSIAGRGGLRTQSRPFNPPRNQDYLQQTRKSAHCKDGMDSGSGGRYNRGGYRNFRGRGASQSHTSDRGDNSGGNFVHVNQQSKSRNDEQNDRAEGGSRGKGKRKKRNKGTKQQSDNSTPSTSRECSQPSSSSTQGKPNNGGAKLELPGYYYNSEAKRYYKIQPGHRAYDDSIVTQQSMERTQAEEQRIKDLEALKIKTSSVGSSVSRRKQTLPGITSVAGAVLDGQLQRGEVTAEQLQHVWSLNCASSLRLMNTRRVFSSQPFDESLEHMLQMERSEENNKLLCLWSVTGYMMDRLQLVTVTPGDKTYPGELSLEFNSSCTTVVQSWNKITSMCWSPLSQSPGKMYVLYTTVCHTGRTQSLAFIRNLDPTNRDQVHFYDFNLGTKMSWTCAWNHHQQRFGVGTEKGCLVVDVHSRRLWQFRTNNSDAISQVFSKEDCGQLMYTGTRSGCILRHDLRSRPTGPTSLMSHKAAVCCLRLTDDERYLYASDFSGKIHKWDLRKKRVVLSYESLFNKQCKLPFQIDASHSILSAAGQDCYTRLWCLRTGRLLQSIPPPYPASMHTIPAVQFSSEWAGIHGNAGLIMGANKSFYLYGSGGTLADAEL